MKANRFLTMVFSLTTVLAGCTSAPAPSTDRSPIADSTPAASDAPSTDQPAVSGTAHLLEAPSGSLYELPIIPAASPLGTVLRSEPLQAPAGIKAWAVLYVSTGLSASRTAVSGIILVPDIPPPVGGRPILAWAHGTTGLGDACAPSHHGADVDLMDIARPFLAAGYVVAATDYEGLGTAGPHPYIVGMSEGRSVLDAARAARLLAGAETGSQVALLGHSQGGHAALWAAELAPTYAPELDVVGVVAAAPAGDLAAISRWIYGPDGTPIAWLNAVIVLSAWHEVYGLPLDEVLRAEGRQLAADLQTTCPDESLAPQEQPLAADPGLAPGWRDQLDLNSPGATRASAPILVLQGTVDEQIPVDSTRSAVRRLCGSGDSVELRILPGADHAEALDQGRLEEAAAWFVERLTGVPAEDRCPASASRHWDANDGAA
jgi:alpha-beta hydrolase superfamily lysophospholipase